MVVLGKPPAVHSPLTNSDRPAIGSEFVFFRLGLVEFSVVLRASGFQNVKPGCSTEDFDGVLMVVLGKPPAVHEQLAVLLGYFPVLF